MQFLKNSTIKKLDDKFLLILPPGQLDRSLYMDIAKSFKMISGEWSRKHEGFIFEIDPEIYLDDIIEGKKINLKKEIQFFPTPAALAEEMIWQVITYNSTLYKPDLKVLEPSAGRGAITNELIKINPGLKIDVCEIDEVNRRFLNKNPNLNLIAEDFLKLEERKEYYDLIIANPPFSKNQDIDHVYKMFECLKPGGTLGSFTSKHWQHSRNKKEVAFKEFLEENGHTLFEIEPRAFKEAGTMVGTNFIIIDKPIKKIQAPGQLSILDFI